MKFDFIILNGNKLQNFQRLLAVGMNEDLNKFVD